MYKNEGYPNRISLQEINFSQKVAEQFMMGPIWPYTNNQQCLNDYPYPESNDLKWWFCMKNKAGTTTVAIIGNSFANQLYPGFANNKMLNHHTFLSIGTCTFAAKAFVGDRSDPCYKERALKQEEYIDSILKNEESIRFVIISGIPEMPDRTYIERFTDKVSALEKSGKTVVIFRPHLKPGFHTKRCFKTPWHPSPMDCKFDSSLRDDLNKNVSSLFDELERRDIGIIFDPKRSFLSQQSM